MNTITIAELRKILRDGNSTELGSLLPLSITVDGKEKFRLDFTDTVVSLTGVHPRMVNRIRNMERVARLGMPLPDKKIKVDTSEIT